MSDFPGIFRGRTVVRGIEGVPGRFRNVSGDFQRSFREFKGYMASLMDRGPGGQEVPARI